MGRQLKKRVEIYTNHRHSTQKLSNLILIPNKYHDGGDSDG